MMPDRSVPVSMGSPRYEARELGTCLVTLVWFPPDAVLEPHVHDRPTFAVILAGGFDLEFTGPAVRRSRLACPPGTILTQPAQERHTNHFAALGAAGVVIQPDLERAELPRRCAEMLDRVNHFRDGPIAADARRLAREIVAPDTVTPLALEALVLGMLAEAARLDLGGGELLPCLRRATDFVHAHFREPVRIRDVAAAAGIHPARLAVLFRRAHRLPLGTYVRRLRLDWAADRLAGTRMPIAAIAAEAGYADQAHLTRSFKRVTGCTPAAYRQVRRGQLPLTS
jgi:AraC family transcriptional regulator